MILFYCTKRYYLDNPVVQVFSLVATAHRSGLTEDDLQLLSTSTIFLQQPIASIQEDHKYADGNDRSIHSLDTVFLLWTHGPCLVRSFGSHRHSGEPGGGRRRTVSAYVNTTKLHLTQLGGLYRVNVCRGAPWYTTHKTAEEARQPGDVDIHVERARALSNASFHDGYCDSVMAVVCSLVFYLFDSMHCPPPSIP